jgi:hypothetical protein
VLLETPGQAENLGLVTFRETAADADYSGRTAISHTMAGLADMLV